MPERLTESLVELGTLEADRAEEALDRQVLQGGALDTSLLELDLVDETSIIAGLEAAYGLSVADAQRALGPADPRALRVFPEPWAKKHMLAPLELSADGEQLFVLSPAPLDAGLLSRLGELLEISLMPVLAPEFRVWQRLARLYDLEPPERFRPLIGELGQSARPSDPPVLSPPPARAPPTASSPPLGFSEAVNRLRDAQDRDEIVRTTLRYAVANLEVVVMFINHDSHLEGWMGMGPGTERLPHLKVDLTSESAFRVVLDTQAHYLGPLPSDEAHGELLGHLGRSRPRSVLIVPVRIRNRTVALLYGENGAEAIAPRVAADLMLFTTHLQMALEGLLMRRKAESLSELHTAEVREPAGAKRGVSGAWAAEVPSQLPVVQTTPGLEPSKDTERGRPPPLSGDAPQAEAELEPEPKPELESSEDTDKHARPDLDIHIHPPEEAIEAEDWEDALIDVAEPEPLQVPLLARSDSWAQATLLPEVEDEDEEPTPTHHSHPLIGGDDGWTPIEGPDLGNALDASISAVQDSLRMPDVMGVFDRSALATSRHGQELLDELDELTSSLEEAVARSEAATPEDPTAPGWDDVDIDEWEDPAQVTPVPDLETEQMPVPSAVPESAETAHARASLTEDATLPDLSAEAWIRASSEVVRARPLPQEVMEAAARPAEPDPVPLTRITIGRQKVELPYELLEVHRRSTEDERYEVPPTPPSGIDGTVPIYVGNPAADLEAPIPLTDPYQSTADEPVPLTQLSTGGYRAESFEPDDPFGYDPGLYDEGSEAEPSLEDVLDPVPRPVSHLRAVPAPTQPVDASQIRAARAEQEALQWLAQLEQGEPQQQQAAVEALTAMGPEALPYVGDRFPGPVTIDPFRPDSELPAFTKCGPLLSVLERYGRDAHPYVLRFLDAPSPHHRFFACYFYGAVYVPEAIPRLIQRLHDEEPRTCMLAARTLFSYREHPDFASVLDHLHGRLVATSSVARRHACYLVGLFRDVTAIPKLIEILDRKDKGMAEVAEDALAEITKQRLGLSAKKWNVWWSKNQSRSRIAWLVDGLAAKEESLRRSAAEELRAVTGLDMGFDESGPKRQREEARQRWIKWWRDQERVANS